MFFNPFFHLSMSKFYPLAKLRRSTLWERFKDTFETIHGRMIGRGQNRTDGKPPTLRLSLDAAGKLQYFYEEFYLDKQFTQLSGSLPKNTIMQDGYKLDNSEDIVKLWPDLLEIIPHIKGYGPDYFTKRKDSNNVWVLTFKENHLGVLDYIFFPILLPIAIYLKGNPGSSFDKVVNILKWPFSFLITLCLSPFVLLAAAISSIVNLFKDQEVECLQIVADTEKSTKTTNIDSKTQEELSREMLQTNSGEIVETTNTQVIKPTEITNVIKKEKEDLMLWHIAPVRRGKISYSVGEVDAKPCIALDSIDNESDWFPYVFSDVNFLNVKIPITEKNKPALRWALESNYDHMLEKLEETNSEGLVQLHASISKY